MLLSVKHAVFALAGLGFISAASAEIRVVDFDNDANGGVIANGDSIANQYKNDAWAGLTITSCLVDGDVADGTDQFSGTCAAPDIADVQVAFDTDLRNTADPDLEVIKLLDGSYTTSNGTQIDSFDTYQSYYENFADSSGNSSVSDNWKKPGNILILDELQNNGSGCGNPCTNPDDEGTRPAGFFKFVFQTPVEIVSLDFFDIEETEADLGRPNNTIFFTIAGQAGLFEQDITATGNDGFARTTYNLFNVTSIVLNMPGSGGIDNLVFNTSNNDSTSQISAPITVSLFMLGIAGLIAGRKKRK